MEESIKQDGQKTVVAFIAGLLIGGLLVWVFSASPEDTNVDDAAETAERTEQTDRTDSDDTEDARTSTNNSNTSTNADKGSESTPTSVMGEGSLSVNDQPAGGVVAIADAEYPSTDGWIVVHDYVGGEMGNALGAARYSTTEGLLPSEVRLLRVTEAGKTYFVVFYSDNGDRVFDLADDLPVMNEDGEMVGDVITAE